MELRPTPTRDSGGVSSPQKEIQTNNAQSQLKRYSLVLPGDLYKEIQKIASNRQITVLELLRKFIKIGLLVIAVEDNPDATLIIREGNTERQIVLV